jgi:hypothetical protein
MARYRLYFIEDGKLPGLAEIEAGDDATAAKMAKELAKSRAVELWCGSRKVRTVAPLKAY